MSTYETNWSKRLHQYFNNFKPVAALESFPHSKSKFQSSFAFFVFYSPNSSLKIFYPVKHILIFSLINRDLRYPALRYFLYLNVFYLFVHCLSCHSLIVKQHKCFYNCDSVVKKKSLFKTVMLKNIMVIAEAMTDVKL